LVLRAGGLGELVLDKEDHWVSRNFGLRWGLPFVVRISSMFRLFAGHHCDDPHFKYVPPPFSSHRKEFDARLIKQFKDGPPSYHGFQPCSTRHDRNVRRILNVLIDRQLPVKNRR
jgi:hypothetical protein